MEPPNHLGQALSDVPALLIDESTALAESLADDGHHGSSATKAARDRIALLRSISQMVTELPTVDKFRLRNILRDAAIGAMIRDALEGSDVVVQRYGGVAEQQVVVSDADLVRLLELLTETDPT